MRTSGSYTCPVPIKWVKTTHSARKKRRPVRAGRCPERGGFAILKANSKEEAIELARQFLQIAGEGECELRQIYEPHGDEHDCPQSSDRAEVALKA